MVVLRVIVDFIYILRIDSLGGLGLGLGLGVLVFEITKSKTPKLAVTFDLKLGGKDPTKDNLTHYTYLCYNLTLYFDGFDFRGS